MSATCLIVDDEPIARRILRIWCAQSGLLTVAGECENGIEAISFLQHNTVDLVFMDINMPVLDGLSFLRMLPLRPAVILTTAYSEHALEAYDLEVIDYLTKPIGLDRFTRAVQRALKQPSPKPIAAPLPTVPPFEGLIVRFRQQVSRIPFDQILYCESRLNNTHIFTLTEEHRIYQPLSKIEVQLPTDRFLRTHRSFIVHLHHVYQVAGQVIHFGKHRVPIADAHRLGVMTALGLSGED
jgi:DNA-binding LytR/AlgR family response regulator